jgi:hypothetical protein
MYPPSTLLINRSLQYCNKKLQYSKNVADFFWCNNIFLLPSSRKIPEAADISTIRGRNARNPGVVIKTKPSQNRLDAFIMRNFPREWSNAKGGSSSRLPQVKRSGSECPFVVAKKFQSK